MRAFVYSLVLLGLVSCGGSAPEFISPADGQTYQLEQVNRIDFAIKDYDRNTNISFRGQQVLAEDIDCVGGPGIAYCQRRLQQGYNNFSFGQSCDTKHPCTITAIADNGKTKSVLTINIQRGGVQNTPTKAD